MLRGWHSRQARVELRVQRLVLQIIWSNMIPTQEQINQFNRVFWREFNAKLDRKIVQFRADVLNACLKEYGWTHMQFIQIKDAAIKQAEEQANETSN